MNIFLSTYSIRVYQRPSKKGDPSQKVIKYLPLDSFDSVNDAYKVFAVSLMGLKYPRKNDVHKTYMKALRLGRDPNNLRILSGVVESGRYGIVSDLRDVDTGKMSYKKKKEDADVLPFYFLISIPSNTNEGILILQRTGQYGIKDYLGKFLADSFSKKHSDFLTEFNALVYEETVKRILSGGVIKKLTCVKYSAPIDRFDGLDEGHKEIPANIEISLSAARVPVLGRINRFFNSELPINKLVELRDFNFDYDTVKVEVDVNGRTRTIDLGNWQKIRNYYDITDLVHLDGDGRPSFDSIDKAAKNYLNDISKLMYPLSK